MHLCSFHLFHTVSKCLFEHLRSFLQLTQKAQKAKTWQIHGLLHGRCSLCGNSTKAFPSKWCPLYLRTPKTPRTPRWVPMDIMDIMDIMEITVDIS